MKFRKKAMHCLGALICAGAMLYADMICSFPSEITMYCGQKHNTGFGAGVSIDSAVFENGRVGDIVVPKKTGSYMTNLKLCGSIPFKRIRINVTKPENIYASGELIGLRLYNKGLIVLKTSEIETGDGVISPAAEAGIIAGDTIVEINGKMPESSSDVDALLTEPTAKLKIKRDNSEHTVELHPRKDKTDGKMKIGVWVRDSTAGVGTMTYYDKEHMTYGALGHGINDTDTGIMFEVSKGSMEKSSVVSVKKGEKGKPGEICGSFNSYESISGTVEINTNSGIFGRLMPENDIHGTLFPIGLMSQVRTGDACILSTVDDEIKQYDIRIVRTIPFGAAAKGMMIKITDEKLLNETGGIIQGMSGSPIIQDGKIIGAVTHVLVNDPTSGYGIYIERMLDEAEKIIE